MHELEFWKGLERHGDAVAIDPGDGATVSYARLVELADAFAARLPRDRQLVALEARNEIEAIVAYVACLRHGHPVVILNTESIVDGRIVAEYAPNWLYTHRNGAWDLRCLTDRADTAFTDELAVLLSTSGTTGAPKLVKLSHRNIASNAGAIATYLGLTRDDCAITTLDFCYSYGMAVLNSHLAAGARILLTDESVVSKRFWKIFQSGGATSLAFVPYHFDLLDRIDFDTIELPTLRYVTQAGGKLHADKIDRYARLAQAKGWSFYVMYGQTEASPRISYVPPDELLANADAIGKPIPGGEIVLIGEDGAEVAGTGKSGELVYRGPNVMLGYAERRADLATPRDTVDLRTGDVAVRQPNGYFKIVGRLSRFIKLYGLRINLDEVEGQLRRAGYQVYCSGNDQTLALFHTGGLDEAAMKALVLDRYKIQTSHIFAMELADMPLLPSGKVNYRALSTMIAPPKSTADAPQSIRHIFIEALGNNVLEDDDSFVGIGGDSLAYLNISMRLEEVLGYLPEDWERVSIAELEQLKPSRSAFLSVPIDTIVRNFAIVAVVANHLTDSEYDGGAIALVLAIGHSLAKYDGDRLPTTGLGRFLWSKLSRILGLYYFILLFYLTWTFGKHTVTNVVSWIALIRNVDFYETPLAAYWFIAAYAQLVFLIAVVWQVPFVRKTFAQRKASFGYIALAIGFLVATLIEGEASTEGLAQNTLALLHVCILGWCAYYATSILQKVIVSVAAVAAVVLFWSNPNIASVGENIWFLEFALLASCFALTWLNRVPVPRALGTFLMWMASISFYIYIMHVIPMVFFARFAVLHEILGGTGKLVVGLLVSIVLGAVAARFMAYLEGQIRRLWANRVAR
jgi:acyl-CoA synthetase (AMP-forming)/AMP-acid ligase II/acyl carrier protein